MDVLCLRVRVVGCYNGIDLPLLRSIQLGWSAFRFNNDASSTLILKGNEGNGK